MSTHLLQGMCRQAVSRRFSDYLLLCWNKCVLFLGPEELVFLVLCSHPSMNSPAHKRYSQTKLFLPQSCPGSDCRNKVYDLKKVVTCFLRYLTDCILTSCSELCGGWEGEWFSSGILPISSFQNFWFGHLQAGGFTHRPFGKLLN